MARNTVDSCILCGEVNCRCGKPAPVKAVPKKASAKPQTVKPDVPKHSPPVRVAPTRTGASRADPTTPERRPTSQAGSSRPSPARVKSKAELEQEELGRAITCFAAEDMLHRDELVKHRDIIDLPRHRIDAMIWKQDNEAESQRRKSG